MSNIIYDFLTESFLFNNEYIEDNYSKFSDSDLKKELNKYRDYVLKKSGEIINEAKCGESSLSIQAESFGHFLPNEKLLKQFALYMDKIIINDPIFDFTKTESKMSNVMNSYLGFEKNEFDRKELIESIKYMKNITPMVAGQFAKFVPISYIHEPTKEIPLYYSENFFSDILPKNILEFFHKHAKVNSFEKFNKEWINKNEFKPSRAISINFKGDTSSFGGIYYLLAAKPELVDEKNGIIKQKMWIPDDMPNKDEFLSWVYQSVNQYSKRFFDGVFKEIKISRTLGCSYLTTSPFVSELLNMNMNYKSNSLKDEINNMFLNLNLPIVQDASIQRLMEVRNNDGEAFKNFRIELQRNLRELRLITDPDLLRKKLENTTHELTEVQINEINNKFNSIKKSAFEDVILFVASLTSTFQTGGISLIGVVTALVKGYKDYSDYISKVKENSMYLLWKIKN